MSVCGVGNACPMGYICEGRGCCPEPMPLCPNGGRATQKCNRGIDCPPGYGCTPMGRFYSSLVTFALYRRVLSVEFGSGLPEKSERHLPMLLFEFLPVIFVLQHGDLLHLFVGHVQRCTRRQMSIRDSMQRVRTILFFVHEKHMRLCQRYACLHSSFSF